MKQALTQRTLSALLLLSAMTAAGTASATPLPDNGCSVATLSGTYSWDESTRTDYSAYNFSENGAGWVFAVSVGKEVNDGNGNITSGQMSINNTYEDNQITHVSYTGTVTVNPNCVGTYHITLEDGESGGGGTIYVDPITRNFTLLDEYNIGVAHFVRDGSGTGLKSPFPQINWP